MRTLRAVTDALVTDGHARAAVAGIRAFGRAGIPVRVLAAQRKAAGLRSRYTSSRAVGPAPADGETAFVRHIAELAREHGPVVVYPGQEEAVGALVRQGGLLGQEAILPYPGPGPVAALIDKSRLAELAGAAGVATPRVLAEGTAAELLADPPPVPAVIKTPEISEHLLATEICETAGELRELLERLPPDERLVVQERVDGPLVSLGLVLDRDGRVVERFQQVARRLWPRDAGASSVGISVAPDPTLVEAASRVLREAGYWGMAQLQFLGRDGRWSVVDANTRFYGSLPLAVAAGATLPAAWHAVVTGEGAPAPGEYRVGMTYHWLEAEISAAYARQRSWLPGRVPRPRVGAMWAWDDPLPGLILAHDAVRARPVRRMRPGS